MSAINELLDQMGDGAKEAFERVFALLHCELRVRARKRIRRGPG